MNSLDRILPCLRPTEDLLVDPTSTEVMVNDGGKHVFVEGDSALESIAGGTREPRNLTVAIKNIAGACGRCTRRYSLDDLVQVSSVPPRMAELLVMNTAMTSSGTPAA